jgi:riboflavin synthase
MFSGIVQAVGRVAETSPRGDGVRLVVDAGAYDIGDVVIGDSIAVSGCCLTAVAIEGQRLAFDVSAETLRLTAALDRRGSVNLEKALRFSDRLGGHLVSGHVDGVGTVVHFAAVGDAAGSWRLDVDAPADLMHMIAVKGSIAVDGVSLTVNSVEASRFSVNLIPHTLEVTTLQTLLPGAPVNLEVDLVARYVARLYESAALRPR